MKPEKGSESHGESGFLARARREMWDIPGPLLREGHLPNLARLRDGGASGNFEVGVPPLSPVAWTGIMTGKNSGKHGIFEFMEHGHDPLKGRVNSSRAIQSNLLWEIAGRHGKKTVMGAIPMSYPPRPKADFPASSWATS